MYPSTRRAPRPASRHALGLSLAAVAAGAATLALAAPAGAGAASRTDAEYWGVTCVGDLGGGRTFFLFGSGTTDGAEGGVGAFVEDASGAVVAEGQATAYGFGETFSAQVPLAGVTLAVDASVVVGTRFTETVDERDGNRWTKGTTSRTELALTPAVASYGDQVVDLGEGACTGDVNEFHVRSSDPAGYVSHDRDFASEICDVAGLADGQVRISGALPEGYVELVLDHGGSDVEKAQGEMQLRGGRGSLTADVVDLFTGEVRTTATVDVELARSGRTVREQFAEGSFSETRAVTPYRGTVVVALDDGRQGTATCSGIAVTTQVRIAPGD